MQYLVRGKTSSKEQVLIIDADSPEAAEQIGWSNGLFVVSVTEKPSCAAAPPAWLAPALNKLRDYSEARTLESFGRPVSPGQTAALLALGVITGMLNLHVAHWI